jgi:multimeric flavodoxin WrbA
VDLDLYARLARADAWAFIGPINWYGPTSNFKLLFDRLVCMNGGNPRPDLIDKKSTVLAQALERSSEWRELSKNHLEGRSAGFFCYGESRRADMDAGGGSIRKTSLTTMGGTPTKAWFGNVVTVALMCRTCSGAMLTSELENYMQTSGQP